MKKFLLLLLSLLMILSMVACDSEAPAAETDTDAAESSSADDVEKPSDDEGNEDEGNNTPLPPLPVDPYFGVATYNIVRCADQGDPDQAIHPDNIVNFIRDNKIAVCGLQEVEINSSRSAGWVKDEYYKQGSHQPKYIADRLTELTGEQYYWAFGPALQGYHKPAHADQGIAQYGNALISKYPIKSSRYVQVAAHEVDPSKPGTQIEDNYEVRSILIATLDVDGADLTVMVTHFGLNESERELAVEKLKAELATIKTPVIFMGDLNCRYTSDIVKEISTLLTPTSRSATPPSTPSGARIDHIFVSEGIKFRNIKSLPLSHSDHYPVLVQVKMPS